MSRPRTLAIAAAGSLAVLLALTPLIPRGTDDDGSILPSGGGKGGLQPRPAETAGASRITPDMRAEIDRVVDQGRAVGRVSGKAGLANLVDDAVRCADFEGQRYCLGVGWTDQTQAQVQARMRTAARISARGTGQVTETGDLDADATVERFARMSPTARADAERAELEDAARSVAKVWLLRHEIQGVPLPADFLAEHPEAAVSTTDAAKAGAKPSASAPAATATPATTSTTKTKTHRDYPRRSTILDPAKVSEQHMSYWCGPTSMQMIAWNWAGKARSQAHWASMLGTTTSGTSITDMVRVTNQRTGWDRPSRAGRYIVLDIGDWSYAQWMLLMMRHIHDYRAPVILHPILLKRYYPYLDDDASGHYQVGRGYSKNGKKPALLGYFEPWNQQRFDPSEPYISRVQWRQAYKSYRANQAHYAHNLGV